MFVQERTWYIQDSVLSAVSGIHWGSWNGSPENKGACYAQMDRPGADGGTGGRGRAPALSAQAWSQGGLPEHRSPRAVRTQPPAGLKHKRLEFPRISTPPHPLSLGAVSRGRPPWDSVMVGIGLGPLLSFLLAPTLQAGEQRERLCVGQRSRHGP